MTDLKMYSNGFDWYIATDMNHVKELVKKFVGESFEELGEEEENWEIVPDDAMITVCIEEEEFDPEKTTLPEFCSIMALGIDGYVQVRALAKEWVKACGPGFLCSTES